MNTGSTPKLSDNRLLSTIGWTIPGATSYALEGSVLWPVQLSSGLEKA